MSSWLWLLLGIALEVTGTVSMKLAAGFTRLTPSFAVFLFYGLSLVAVTLALRGIQISTAYAVWSAVGTAAIATIGYIAFREPLTPARLTSFSLIILGVVGLNLTAGGPFFLSHGQSVRLAQTPAARGAGGSEAAGPQANTRPGAPGTSPEPSLPPVAGSVLLSARVGQGRGVATARAGAATADQQAASSQAVPALSPLPQRERPEAGEPRNRRLTRSGR